MKHITALAGLALAVNPIVSQAAAPETCLAPTEVDALIRFAMPDIANAVANQCAASLGTQSYLKRNQAALLGRFAGPSKAALPRAKAAFAKMTNMPDLSALGDGTMHDLIGIGVTSAFAKLKPADCTKADQLLGLLDPLPPENMAGLVTFILQAASENSGGKEKSTPFKVCPHG